MTAGELPPPPTNLHHDSVADAVRSALQRLYDADRESFVRVFGHKNGDMVPVEWQHLSAEIDLLAQVGILYDSDRGRLRSHYLITPWAGAYYLADFPDSGHLDEVFSPHVETRFFLTLLQVRPGDSVLDLGSGSGILLLESVRRGATGIGIDISQRALDFARANAFLNGLAARVQFLLGDMTRPPVGNEWGNPTVVLCNPPFEPVPPEFRRPLHSDGGPRGISVISDILAAFGEWKRRAEVIQLVLLSLGRPATTNGDHLLLKDMLIGAAKALGADLELRELLQFIPLKEYLIHTFGGGQHASQNPWLRQLTAEGFQGVHLLFANLYPERKRWRDAGRDTVRWVPFEGGRTDDECFLWSLVSPKRRTTSRGSGDVGESDLWASHVSALIHAREETMAGARIDLRLDHHKVSEFLDNTLRHETIFGQVPLVILDLLPGSEGKALLRGVLRLGSGDFPPQSGTGDMQSLVAQTLGTRIGVIGFNVIGQAPFVLPYTDAGDLEVVLPYILQFPEAPDLVQGFAVLSAADASLSERGHRCVMNVFSEVAKIALTLFQEQAVEAERLMRTRLDAILHTALNTLRSIQSGTACDDFGDGEPVNTLKYRLTRVSTRKRDTSRERTLIETLNRVWVGEETTARALSLARIVARGGRIPYGQRARSPYLLLAAAERTAQILDAYARGKEKAYQINLDRTLLARGRLPSGYLEIGLLAAIVYELYLNGYRHAPEPIELEIGACCEGVRVALTVSSRLGPAGTCASNWETRDGISLRRDAWQGNRKDSFLFSFKAIEEALHGGLAITTCVCTRDGKDWYETTLHLGPVEQEGGGTISPEWVEG